MKKLLLISIILGELLFANNTNISYEYGIKDYKNSASKIDGKIQILNISHKIFNHKFKIGYQNDNVDRTLHPISEKNRDLDIEKYNIKYIYKLNGKLNFKTSYIKIIDNFAPTDQGKVYGIGTKYAITESVKTAVNIYKSNYDNFNINQYDFSISKGFKIHSLKLRSTLIAKKINIDGEKYGNYIFKDKNYFTTGLKLGVKYNGFTSGVGAFFGKRIFSVLDDGMKVQHHAMEQDKTYMISLGKKIKNFDILAKYSYQNGKELPENRDNIDIEFISLSLTYKF